MVQYRPATYSEARAESSSRVTRPLQRAKSELYEAAKSAEELSWTEMAERVEAVFKTAERLFLDACSQAREINRREYLEKAPGCIRAAV